MQAEKETKDLPEAQRISTAEVHGTFKAHPPPFLGRYVFSELDRFSWFDLSR